MTLTLYVLNVISQSYFSLKTGIDIVVGQLETLLLCEMFVVCSAVWCSSGVVCSSGGGGR